MKITMEKEEWELNPKKLRVKKLIGYGGFGLVYAGVYDGKKVAVKIFDLGDEKKNSSVELMEEVFMQEVSIWSTLEHSNIAKFIGAIKKNDMSKIKMKCQKGSVNGCCIVVEYVGGGTLTSYLSKYTMKKKLPLDTILQLAIDVAKGLSYLHLEKIAHRDVKTENLLLDKTGRVKIIDFGISSPFFSLGLNYPPMMVGTTGTIGYMAPEVLSEVSYDHKCDVYSFGICLWEMYTCLDPYPEHISRSKISNQIYMDRRPEIPKCCPTALSDIMKKCWDAKPQNRPEMKEVLQMLQDIQTSTGKRKHMPLTSNQQSVHNKLSTNKGNMSIEGERQVKEVEENRNLSNEEMKLIGSSPPSCEHKCYGCMPCEAIQVPTNTGRVGVQYTNYEPEGWKCKCGPAFYTP
ncbi:hypothetical protein KY285_018257 [Solanum tuberosum]|nr:hypothetical protein KY289_018412 [Solanum tuberosum]KAH0703979.1 hypothetical protein KY285_018257 [Solanum tuberosum]